MKEELKSFNIRIPKSGWKFLKKAAAEQETSMMNIILVAVGKYKEKYEKRLTKSDAKV